MKTPHHKGDFIMVSFFNQYMNNNIIKSILQLIGLTALLICTVFGLILIVMEAIT